MKDSTLVLGQSKGEGVAARRGRLADEAVEVGARLRGHAHPPRPLLPRADLAQHRLVHRGEARAPQEGLPLHRAIRAHVGRIAAFLHLEDEGRGCPIVVAEDVLQEQRAARPQGLCHLAHGGPDVGEVVGGDAAGDDVEALVERQGLHVAGGEGDVGDAARAGKAPGGLEHGRGEVVGHDALREGGEREGGVAAAGGHVEHAARPQRPPPAHQGVEVHAPGVPAAGDVVGRAPSELLLDRSRVGLAHAVRPREIRWR